MKKETERSVDEIAYSPEVNKIRPILAKYLNEWSNKMLVELAQTLQTERQRCEEMVEAERDRCTDLIAEHCSFAIENSKSREIQNFASSLANRLYSVITQPNNPE